MKNKIKQSDTVIETSKLAKKFGRVTAVDGVSLKIKRGEIYGFLGLNGAGKTTTIRMLLGMIAPDSGSARVLGQTIRRGENGPWNRIGCLVEIPYSYPDLTVRENLEIQARLRNLKDPKAIDHILDALKLQKYAGRNAGQLSLGNSQRLGLAKALLHDPELLILDEPSNGLDPNGIVEIRELLLDLSENRGKTIFISSHILAEISKIAGRFGIIHQGRLIHETDTRSLNDSTLKRLIIKTRDNRAAFRLLSENNFHPEMNGGGDIEIKERKSLQHPEKINTFLVSHQLPPYSLYIDREDLESYFQRITAKKGESQ